MNLFSKFLRKGTEGKAENQSDEPEPADNLPIDERFATLFTRNGGRFLYSVDEQELKNSLGQIITEHGLKNKKALCYDPGLQERFKSFPIEFSDDQLRSHFFITGCESLIADKGELLFTSHQTKDKQISSLPEYFIVIATSSQIVTTTTEAMQNINSQYKGNMPSNIRPLKNFNTSNNDDQDIMKYGSPGKIVYLLLLENL